MLKQNAKEASTSIFELVSEQIVGAIQADPLFLQTNLYVNNNNNQEVRAILTSQFITLTELGWFDRPYHYFVRIDDDLKFQALREREIGKALGFILQKIGAASVELTFTKQELSEVWIKQMGRLLTQIGFHRLFKPVKKLGKGGFATVYEVLRLTDGQYFAVKAFSKQSRQLTQNQNQRRTLLNEINIMRAVNSPNLMKLEGVFESDNSIYIVLQLLSAGQMHSLINRREGRFSSQEIRQFMAGMARGLTDIHNRGIMHRDIKPQNIVLRKEGCLQPVIVDFGLAAFVNADDYVLYRCGTPGYVAPQITTLFKGQKIEPVCDIFSLGAIFNILLVRRPLFQGRGFEQVYENNRRMRFDLNNPIYNDVDPVAIDLLSRMLKINPHQRIRAAEMLQHPFLLGWVKDQEKDPAIARTLDPSRVSVE